MAHSEAFVTLVTSDDYGIGALVLAHSLRESGTTRKIVCMVGNRTSSTMQNSLKDVFDEVILVDPIRSNSRENLVLLGRPDLLFTFTKLHLWNLTQFSKVVFLDADTLVLSNVDDLFLQERFSACSDIGWPDCFNSGVFVAFPSHDTFTKLLRYAQTEGSFDGGDQGLLNDFFSDWNRLPFIYNVTPSATYSYAPAYKRFGHQIKIVHYIGVDKPWTWDRFSTGGVMPKGRSLDAMHLVQKWWDLHDRKFSKSPAPQQSSHAFDHYFVPGPGGMSAHQQSNQHDNNNSTPPNPFFKSRYDWDESELKMKNTGANTKKMSPDFEDERKIPLKKSQPASVSTSPSKKK